MITVFLFMVPVFILIIAITIYDRRNKRKLGPMLIEFKKEKKELEERKEYERLKAKFEKQ